MTLPKHLASTALLIVFGAAAVWLSLDYELGTLRDMGPGMFPLVLGLLVAVLGCVYGLVAHRGPSRTDNVVFKEAWPFLTIVGAVLLFALLLEPFGLIAALSALVAGAWLANADRKLWELPVMLLVYNGLTYVIFIVFLNIPIRLGPL